MVKKSDRNIDMVVGPSGSRVFKQLSTSGSTIGFVSRGLRSSQTSDVVPTIKGAPLPNVLPKTGVRKFVESFALSHGVKATRTKLDVFAEAVTRLAGDEVKLDQVGQTLVALHDRKLVSGDEMIRLMHSHIHERKRVQSLR